MKRKRLPLYGEPGFSEGAQEREDIKRNQEIVDGVKKILDRAATEGRGDRWAIIQIMNITDWTGP